MIVGHNPIVVDDEIWPIATPCRVRAFGPALEFEQSWVPSERLIMKEFRVPFGRGADDEVARVVAYFSTPRPPVRKVSRVQILLVLVLGLTLFILIAGWLTDWR